VQKVDENAVPQLFIVAIAPPVAAYLLLFLSAKVFPKAPIISLLVGLVALVAGIILAASLILRYWSRYRNDHLGYLGERAVAEELDLLRAKGYRVFHDVPAEGRARDFNLDHVAIGPTGVAMIETKARRKGRVRDGYEDYKVFYDGKQLIWPWEENRDGLDQVVAEADWLREWIERKIGLKVYVKSVLTMPGWWVEQKARGPVTVVDLKHVCDAVEGRGDVVLNAEQIDLIARQLDQLCRDVED
jgi:hypothetical protein